MTQHDITLTDEQSQAAFAIRLWHRDVPKINNRKPYYFLSGYAGTGKTTLIKYIITSPEYLNLDIADIKSFRTAERAFRNQESTVENPGGPPPSYATAFAAFTAKAAQVMQTYPNELPAGTIHSLLYAAITDYAKISDLERQLSVIDKKNDPTAHKAISAELKEAKQPRFEYIPPSSPRSRLRNTKLIVLDECSMIGGALWQDLLRTNIPMIILGDNNQLPPVKDTAAPFTQGAPDFQLVEIHRYALENPITDFATRARTREQIPFKRLTAPTHCADNPQLAARMPMKHFMANHLTQNDLTWFDQIICATHRRRFYLNKLYRSLMMNTAPQSLPIFPQVGERIVCGKNDHQLQIYNGQTYTVTKINQESYDEVLQYRFNPTVGVPSNPKDPFDFSAQVKNKPNQIKFQLTQTDPSTGELDPSTAVWVRALADVFFGYNEPDFVPSNDFFFDYGYAITVHKAQGSQWPRVLVWNEKMGKQTLEEYFRWLYTACTRASKCVVLAG